MGKEIHIYISVGGGWSMIDLELIKGVVLLLYYFYEKTEYAKMLG